jgi:hypothetical protein
MLNVELLAGLTAAAPSILHPLEAGTIEGSRALGPRSRIADALVMQNQGDECRRGDE